MPGSPFYVFSISGISLIINLSPNPSYCEMYNYSSPSIFSGSFSALTLSLALIMIPSSSIR